MVPYFWATLYICIADSYFPVCNYRYDIGYVGYKFLYYFMYVSSFGDFYGHESYTFTSFPTFMIRDSNPGPVLILNPGIRD